MKTRSLSALVAVSLVVAACSGATPGDLFDKSGASPGSDGGPIPTTTTTTTSPTTTTTTEPPPPPPPGEEDAGLKADCSDQKPSCPTGQLCEIVGCVGNGKCVPASSFGTDPVCGCDKYTYASALLVRGEAVRGSGECPKANATPCTNGCSNGAKCNLRVSNALSCEGAAGTCWKMPSSCPPAQKGFRACGTTACFSACEAILQGRKHFADGLCN